MDRFVAAAVYIIVFSIITETLGVNINQKIRQHDKRLANLELKTTSHAADMEVKMDDIYTALVALNESQCESPPHRNNGVELTTTVDTTDGIESGVEVADVISRFQIGFKEEKEIRKLAIVNMKYEMSVVGDELNKTVHSELGKVNDVIAADRDRVTRVVNQLDRLEKGLRDTDDKLERSLGLVGDKLNKTVHSELGRVNNVIAADRDLMTRVVNQLDRLENSLMQTNQRLRDTDDKLERSLGFVNESIATSLIMLRDNYTHNTENINQNDDTIAKLETLLADLKRNVTINSLAIMNEHPSAFQCAAGNETRHWNGHIYRAVLEMQTYDEAVDTCQQCNSHLVDIQSKAELDLISSVMRGNYLWLRVRKSSMRMLHDICILGVNVHKSECVALWIYGEHGEKCFVYKAQCDTPNYVMCKT